MPGNDPPAAIEFWAIQSLAILGNLVGWPEIRRELRQRDGQRDEM